MIPGITASVLLDVAITPGDTGWQSPGTMVNTGWTNADNAKASDNSRATVSASGYSSAPDLVATNFNFSSIPTGANVIKIELSCEGYYTDTYCGGTFKCVVDNVAVFGGIAINLPVNTEAIRSAAASGNGSDIWQLSGTALAKVQESDFGFALNLFIPTSAHDSYTIYIDHMRMKVHWGAGFASSGDTGWVTGDSRASIGASTANWASTGNVTVEDGVFSTCSISAYESGDDLRLTYMTYMEVLPPSATITQIEVRIKMKSSDVDNATLRLVVDDTIAGNASTALSITATNTMYTVSSAGGSNTWGLSTAQLLKVTENDFGMILTSVDNDSGTWGPASASVDVMQMRIHWDNT